MSQDKMQLRSDRVLRQHSRVIFSSTKKKRKSQPKQTVTNLDNSVNEDAVLFLDDDDVDGHVLRQADGGAVVASKADLNDK